MDNYYHHRFFCWSICWAYTLLTVDSSVRIVLRLAAQLLSFDRRITSFFSFLPPLKWCHCLFIVWACEHHTDTLTVKKKKIAATADFLLEEHKRHTCNNGAFAFYVLIYVLLEMSGQKWERHCLLPSVLLVLWRNQHRLSPSYSLKNVFQLTREKLNDFIVEERAVSVVRSISRNYWANSNGY